MYGKIFEDIFYSSLMHSGGWLSTYTFMSLVTLADKEGYVRFDERALFRLTGLEIDTDISFDRFKEALRTLEDVDTQSNIPDYDGRRIISISQLDDIQGNRGYWIVNYAHYREKGSKAERQEQNRVNQQAVRNRAKSSADVSARQRTSADGHSLSAMSAHTDTDTDTDINNTCVEIDTPTQNKKGTSPEFEQFWGLMVKKRDKLKCYKKWKARKLDKRIDEIIQGMNNIITHCGDWNEGFIPLPYTIINGEKWNDEPTKRRAGKNTAPTRGDRISKLKEFSDGDKEPDD